MQVWVQVDAKHVCVACCEYTNVFETIWSALKRVSVGCSVHNSSWRIFGRFRVDFGSGLNLSHCSQKLVGTSFV